VFAALAFAVALATAGCSEDDVGRPPATAALKPAEVARVRASTDFGLYYVGASYRGFPLTKIYESPASDPYKSVTFWYGDCEPVGGEGACGYDFTMSVYDVCGRHFKLFKLPRSRLTNIRGVPSGEFGNGLELYTGDSVIVIGSSPDAAEHRDAAAKLRSLDGRIVPPEDLLSPVKGALTGRPAGCEGRIRSVP
jgi:hypothetical protein